eukprot:13027108-Alexandrium_andersonii.AAC.1
MLEPPATLPRAHGSQEWAPAARLAEKGSALMSTKLPSCPEEAAERGSAEPRSATMKARGGLWDRFRSQRGLSHP